MVMDCAKKLKNNFLKLVHFLPSRNSSATILMKLSNGLTVRLKLSRKFLVTEGTSLPLPMPVGPYLFWRRLVVIMPRL
jgi:hypothetical protein